MGGVMAALTVITSKTGAFSAAGRRCAGQQLTMSSSKASTAAARIFFADMVLISYSLPPSPPTFVCISGITSRPGGSS